MNLHEIRVRQFRNVVSTTQLTFSPGINVFLGANGTGKTTLLELISAVFRSDFSAFAHEPLSIEYTFVGYAEKVQVSVRSFERKRLRRNSLHTNEQQRALLERVPVSGSVEIVASTGDALIKVSASNTGSKVELSDGREFTGPPVDIFKPGFATSLAFAFESQPDLMTRLLHLMSPDPVLFFGRYDEALGYFGYLMSSFTVDAFRPPNDELVVYAFGGAPPDLLEAARVQLTKDPTVDAIRLSTAGDSPPAFLEKIRRLLGFAIVTMRLDRLEKSSAGSLKFGDARFEFQRSDGSIVSHSQLSFGQRRLLAFMIYVASSSVIVADELVNGLHYSWIRECLDAVEGRQTFLTSQNPLLLDHLHFSSPDQVRTSFIRCSIEQLAASSKVYWTNFSAKDAEMFYSAYRTGIQPVGEILRTKGLW